MSNYGMSEIRSRSLCGAAMFVLLACGMGQATAEGATIYSQDPNLTDFTSTITTYGTFVSGTYQGLSGFATLTPSNPFTPTSGTFASANYPRVIGGSTNPVDVTFGTATNQIVVFDNIDHPGNAWDVFQYKIFGSNDGGSNFTQLFNPKTALGPDLSGNFQLGTYDGTAPILLNNYSTPGPGSFVGNIGYEEYFTFSTSYNYYRFLPSTLDIQTGENELELSAVGIAAPSQTIIDTAETPEPASFLIASGGLAVGLVLRRRCPAISRTSI